MQFPEKRPAIDFLKLEAGKTAVVVFAGELFRYRRHWHDNRSSFCKAKSYLNPATFEITNTGEICDLCDQGIAHSFRFRTNVILKENGAIISKVFEQGSKVFDMLLALKDDYDPTKHWIKITKTGSGKDTKYSLMPYPNGKVTDEQISLIDKTALTELGLRPMPKPTEKSFEESQESEIPF